MIRSRSAHSYSEMIPLEDEVRGSVQALERAATVVIKVSPGLGWFLEVRSSRPFSEPEKTEIERSFESVGLKGVIADPVIPVVLPFRRPVTQPHRN